MEINKQNEYKILLVDSASTDGSFEELCELGEKLSMETKIPFETIQLRKRPRELLRIRIRLPLLAQQGSRLHYLHGQ
jgi:hypothetical protein